MWCSIAAAVAATVAAAVAVTQAPAGSPPPEPIHVFTVYKKGELGERGGEQCAWFLPGTDRVVVGTRNRLRVLDWRAGHVTELPAAGLQPFRLGASADARYVVASSGTILHAWDLTTQQRAGQVERKDYFRGIGPAGPRGGFYALNARRAELVYWDVAAGRSEAVLDVTLSPAVPPDTLGGTGDGLAVHAGRVAAVAVRPGFAVVDLAAKAVTKFVTLPGGGGVGELAFSADGSRLVASHRHDLIVFDTTTWTEVAKCRIVSREAGSIPREVALTPDGQTLVAAVTLSVKHPSGVMLFDAATGRELGYFETHPSAAPGLSVSSDGKYLATAWSDGVKIWDLAAIVADFRKAAR